MIAELKVPFMKEADIEHAAADVLRRFAAWKGVPVRPPIDIDAIIEGFYGLDLVFIDLPDFLGIPDVLGATFIDERRVFIDQSLDLEGKEGRLAFTLAHEAGHWELHRPIIEANRATAPLFSAGDMPEQPAILCRSSQKPPVEWQADRFAASLLMPSVDVRATVRAVCGDKLPSWEGLEERRKNRELDERLRDLAGEVICQGSFGNVSNEAMRYRLLDLRLVVDASNPQRSLL